MSADRLFCGLMALSLNSLGCTRAGDPVDQTVLFISTDAPLPYATTDGSDDRTSLFDRLRLDFYPEGAGEPCASCAQTVALTHDAVEGGRVSFGVIQESSSGGVLRARMYLSTAELSSTPSRGGTVDRWVRIPQPTEGGGVEEVTVFLSTWDVGHPRGSLAEPETPTAGPPDPDIVGSWEPARTKPCDVPSPPGMACVPGGVFWMGDPRIAAGPVPGVASDIRRLVILDPFFVDLREVTVVELRQSGLVTSPNDPEPWNGENANSTLPDDPTALCNWSETASERDELPVNCLSKQLAAAYCAQRDAQLPTEAQLEYLMGGLESQRHPWGIEPARCGDATHALAWTDLGYGFGDCRPEGETASARPAGRGLRDRLDLEGGLVVDLAGNVSELAADLWNRQDEPCWGFGVFDNPLCLDVSPVDGQATAIRGGNWASSPELLAAGVRNAGTGSGQAIGIGFRCARQVSSE